MVSLFTQDSGHLLLYAVYLLPVKQAGQLLKVNHSEGALQGGVHVADH